MDDQEFELLGDDGEELPPDDECQDYYREQAEYYGDYSHLECYPEDYFDF